MKLCESTVCSNKEQPTVSWVFWKTSHNVWRWASQIPASPPEEILKNPNNPMHLRYRNQKLCDGLKGHNRWDTATQKLFINMLHTVAWNTVMIFNSYIEMFFASSRQFMSKQKNTNDFKFSSFWKMFGKCYDRFVPLLECQIHSTKCKENPKSPHELLLLLDRCSILIKMYLAKLHTPFVLQSHCG